MHNSAQHSSPLSPAAPQRYLSVTFCILSLLLFFGSGCGGSGGGGEQELPDMMAQLQMESSYGDNAPRAARSRSAVSLDDEQLREATDDTGPSEVQERKLITDGNISFEVDRLQETRQRVADAVEEYEAYISSDEEYNSEDRISISMVIRVPSQHFDALLNDVTSEVRRLDSKQINVRDVTEEFVDIQARLRSKKELETRYAELLEQARAVSDMLEIERQMEQLRSQIESIEGRLRYLQSQVTLSTLRLNFYERQPSDLQFGRQFTDGLRSGWNNLVYFFLFMLRLWPFILILAGLIWGAGRWRKRRKKNSSSKTPQD